MPKTSSESEGGSAKTRRPFIGVSFECCGTYARIYREPTDRSYEGRCPKCLRTLVITVDPKNGVASKFLKAK